MTNTISGNSILIVDDTPENLTVLRQMLTENGYRVRPALNGKTALTSAENDPPDLILLDIMMPGMNGYEVCQKLKSNERVRDVPVLFISALDEAIDKVKAFKEGGLDYITKPFHLEEVLARVKTHLTLRNVQMKLQDQNIRLQKEIEYRKQAEASLEKSNLHLETANKELEKLVGLDGLTKIGNRRYFDEYLDRECQRLTRENGSLALILSDIDYFKNYNDTYGHLAGDDCLKQVAQGISNSLKRPADIVARYGGEEFVIVLPNTDLNGAIGVAETIKSEIANLKILHEQSAVSQYVSLSFGVSCTRPDQKRSPEALINTADQSLYQAKASGRNQIKSKTIKD
jgi:diguanylate cyclase (GGDEF)-like protein